MIFYLENVYETCNFQLQTESVCLISPILNQIYGTIGYLE